MPLPDLDPDHVRFFALVDNQGVQRELVVDYIEPSGASGFARARAVSQSDLGGLRWKRLDDRAAAVAVADTFIGVDAEDTVWALELAVQRQLQVQSC
jgi:hypothetical protein